MTDEILEYQNKIKELENEISVLKLKQVEINKAKELYLKIFEDFPALIWRSRLDKLCDYFNRTWLDFTGRTMEQEFGNGWAEGVHPDDFDFCLKIYVTAFDKREPFLMEYRMKNKFGEYCWIRDFGRPFYDLDNTFLGYIGSCYDITENKNNELKLIELVATKDRFFSIIAHDLKSPLHTLLGFSELLIKNSAKYTPEKILEFAQNMNNVSNQTYALLENLLEWSRFQTGKLKSNPLKIKPSEIISNLILLCEPIAKSKTIDLQIINNCDDYIFADKEMIKTILRNLLTNAMKFTDKNGIVKIVTQQTENAVLFIISDTGIGIEPEHIPNIFKIDRKLSKLGTFGETGTGLGLILCKEFVEKNSGKIWIESELGKGSDFKFTMPLFND